MEFKPRMITDEHGTRITDPYQAKQPSPSVFIRVDPWFKSAGARRQAHGTDGPPENRSKTRFPIRVHPWFKSVHECAARRMDKAR